MKHTLLHRFASIVLTLGTFLSVASVANADTLTLPQPLSYDGLTVVNPLTYEGSFGKQTQKFTFAKQTKLALNKTTKEKPLEAIVVTPAVSVEPTKTQTATLLPTPTLYVKPTISQVSTKLLQPTITSVPATPVPQVPTVATQANVGGLNPETLFAMTNTYRQSRGLPALQKDERTCSLAASRAPEVAGEIAAGTMHSGLHARNLPYWNTENVISMNSEQAAFNWWLNDGIHHAAIVSNSTHSCVACSGNSCAQEFTSYSPK